MGNKIQIFSPHQTEFSYAAFFKLGMIDFSTSIFIIFRSNIFMAPTYGYEKQQIKLFLSKRFPDRQIELKN